MPCEASVLTAMPLWRPLVKVVEQQYNNKLKISCNKTLSQIHFPQSGLCPLCAYKTFLLEMPEKKNMTSPL